MARKTPTLDEFKQFSRDIAPAARAVLLARIHVDHERERVNAYIRPIFDRYRFEYGAIAKGLHTGPIEDPKYLYLADDGPKMDAYFEECDAAHRAHGFTGPHGHCPALVAETLLMETERAFIELAEPLFGIRDVYGDDRAKYLELLIGAALKAESEAADSVQKSRRNQAR